VAARLFARRWALYLLTSAVVFGLEALFYAFVHVKGSDLYAAIVASPLISVVATVFSGADAMGILPTARERWSRIVERAWAIVVIDFGVTYIWWIGRAALEGNGADFGSVLLGMLVLILGAMLVYAEPFVCLEENVRMRTIVFVALLRSMTLAWVNMSRVFSLFAIQLGLGILALLAHDAAHTRGMHDANWIDLAFAAFVTAPVAVLITVAYLDTLSQEQR
jgi:hypothetical protein